MKISIEDIESEAKKFFSTRSADYAKRGLVSPENLVGLNHDTAKWRLGQRINKGVENLEKVFQAFHLSYSDNLTTELKALLEPFVSDIWCKQQVDRYGRVNVENQGRYDNDLFQERKAALCRANAQIDLWVDEIRNSPNATRPASKELEQKFGILFSAGQAKTDFDQWTTELKRLRRSLAILFVDIDNFKRLNKQYTESVVDETILPQAMHLLGGLAYARGEAYRQGGEEFLLILPNMNEQEATSFAEKVRSEFEGTDFQVNEDVNHLTVSIGIALWPKHGSTYSLVLKKANQAEKIAKQIKNCWGMASDETTDQINQTLRAFRHPLEELPAEILTTLIKECPDGLASKRYKITELQTIFPDHSEEAIQDACYDLDHLGLLQIQPQLTGLEVRLKEAAYEQVDHQIMQWNPKEDALELAKLMIETEEGSAPVLLKQLGWPKRRFNPAQRIIMDIVPEECIRQALQPNFSTIGILLTPQSLSDIKRFIKNS